MLKRWGHDGDDDDNVVVVDEIVVAVVAVSFERGRGG